MYQKFSNYANLNYFKFSNSSLNNVNNRINQMNLSYDEFNKLINQMMDKNFQEKLIAFNLIKNEPEHDKRIYNIVKINKEKYNNLIGKKTKLMDFIKTFFDKIESKYIKEINKQKMQPTQPICTSLQKLEKFLKDSKQYKE